MNLFESMEELFGELDADPDVFGVQVTLQRGADVTLLVPAKLGKTSDQIASSFGSVRLESRDFIIRSIDYVIGTGAVEPARNDFITEADGAKWQVLPDNGVSAWDYHDLGKTSFRIRTKRVE